MSVNVCLFLMFAGTFFTAVSQVLLKQSAGKSYKNFIREYLNVRVITAYILFFGILLVNTYAYTKVDLKYGAVIDTISYVFVMLLSYLVLKERFTKGQLFGNLLIIIGVLIYMT